MEKNDRLALNANPVVAFLKKLPHEFTKQDIIRFIEENGIEMVNFMYPGGDGKLKTLNFVISDRAYLNTILTCGERVDGSSLFSFIEASASDLYVLPRFSTAFVDPFAEICSARISTKTDSRWPRRPNRRYAALHRLSAR